MTLQAKAASLSRTAAALFKVYLSRFLRLSGFGLALNLIGLIVLALALGGRHFLFSLFLALLATAVWVALAHKQALQSCLHKLCEQHLSDVLPYLISKLPWDKLPGSKLATAANTADAAQQKQQALQQISTTLQQIQLPSMVHKVLARVGQTSLASIVLQAHAEIDFQQGASPTNVEKLSAIAAQHIDTEALAPSAELPGYVLAGNCGLLLLLLVFG